jgi:hypothetical protein
MSLIKIDGTRERIINNKCQPERGMCGHCFYCLGRSPKHFSNLGKHDVTRVESRWAQFLLLR